MKKELGLITGNLVLIGKFFTGCAAKFMKHAICLLFISILCISSDVLSSEFNYNYLQIAYTRIPDPEANGVSVSCSFDISKEINLLLDGQFGFYDNDSDSKLGGIGAGFHSKISEKSDFILSASFIFAEVEQGWRGTYSDNGYAFSLGIRNWNSDKVELNADLGMISIFDETELAVGLGIRFYSKSKRSFGLHCAYSNEEFGIGLSYRF